MGLNRYGVLKGRVTNFDGERTDEASPHMEITIKAGGETFRAAVNVKSAEQPSQVVFLAIEDYAHPQLTLYPPMAQGFRQLETHAGSGALDFIRGNLFAFEDVVALPHNAPGRDDDLLDKLSLHLQRAKERQDEIDIYVFGEPFPSGIHDVHMNQGSIGRFASSNGVWQDGALFLHDRVADRWTALFLAFQSQAIHTDDTGGNALPGSQTFADIVAGRPTGPTTPTIPAPPTQPTTPTIPTTPITPDGLVRIVAALVNPKGPEDVAGGESVTLLNTGLEAIDLAGWTLASTKTSHMPLAGLSLGAGEALRVKAVKPLTLSNKGGIISLLDSGGNRVHGVSYTKAQAGAEGFTLTF